MIMITMTTSILLCWLIVNHSQDLFKMINNHLSLDDHDHHHHQHLIVLTYCQPLSGSIHGQRASQHSAHTQSVCLPIHCGQSSIFIVIIIIFFHYPAGQPWLRNFVFSGMTSGTIQSMQLEGLEKTTTFPMWLLPVRMVSKWKPTKWSWQSQVHSSDVFWRRSNTPTLWSTCGE